MIICRGCGVHNDDGTVFCTGCGVFLEWEGERVPEQRRADGEPADATPAPEDGESVPGAAAVAVGAAATGASDVAVRQPEQTRRRRPTPRRPAANVPTGSLICGGCAMPNEASRRFCAKCGTSLAEARVVRKAPWWRRLVGRERVYEAGERRRPRGRRRARTVGRLLVLLVLVAGVLVLLGPGRGPIGDAVGWVRTEIQGPEQVRPVAQTAGAELPDHAVGAAFDGDTGTYWASPPVEAAVPWVRAELGEPVRLRSVGITPGVSLETPAFVAGPRPLELEITVTTGTDPVTERFPLEDVPGFQELTLDVRDARAVQVSVVAGAGATAEVATALVEVELYANR